MKAEAFGDRVNTLRISVAQRGGEVDQLADRHLERRWQLRHEADGAEYRRPVASRVEAVDGDFTVVRVFAEQAADQGGLAGAVRANQGNPFAKSDIEADAVEHARTAEVFDDVIELDHGARL